MPEDGRTQTASKVESESRSSYQCNAGTVDDDGSRSVDRDVRICCGDGCDDDRHQPTQSDISYLCRPPLPRPAQRNSSTMKTNITGKQSETNADRNPPKTSIRANCFWPLYRGQHQQQATGWPESQPPTVVSSVVTVTNSSSTSGVNRTPSLSCVVADLVGLFRRATRQQSAPRDGRSTTVITSPAGSTGAGGHENGFSDSDSDAWSLASARETRL